MQSENNKERSTDFFFSMLRTYKSVANRLIWVMRSRNLKRIELARMIVEHLPEKYGSVSGVRDRLSRIINETRSPAKDFLLDIESVIGKDLFYIKVDKKND